MSEGITIRVDDPRPMHLCSVLYQSYRQCIQLNRAYRWLGVRPSDSEKRLVLKVDWDHFATAAAGADDLELFYRAFFCLAASEQWGCCPESIHDALAEDGL